MKVSSQVFSLALVRLAIAAEPPAAFLVNPNNAGGGGTLAKASPHFQVFNANEAQADAALKLLESAYSCFVDTLGWRSSGLSYRATNDDGPWYKMNAYGVANPQAIGNAAGVMGSDAKTGAAFIKVVQNSLPQAGVTVHEYGHALTYYEKYWVDQGRTGTWWEPLAEFMADLYMTSPWCEPARTKYGQKQGRTIMNLQKVVGGAHQVLVDGTANSPNANYYQSWPFMAYLTYNPDKYPGLGKTAVRDMIRKYRKGSNETPFHALAIVAGTTTSVQKIVGRYWARMANGDIGHPQGREAFNQARAKISFANLDPAGEGSYKVKEARKPKYMGANIIPLKGSGKVSVKITAAMPFTATLAIRGAGTFRYVDLPEGAGSADLAAGETASLVIANTPKSIIMYNGFEITPTHEVSKGLSYTLQLTGATA
jgi:hypothetical protein